MNRNFVLNGESVEAAVRALYSEVSDQLSSNIYYSGYGFTDFFPDIPEEKLSSVSGFGKGKLTVAGQQYGSNERYKGYAKQLDLNKYTSEISYSEEDLHWLAKAPTAKRVMEFRDNVEGAVNALNANLNEDAAKLFYLAHGTTFFTGGDGVALASGSHPTRKSGVGNQSNLFSSTHLSVSADNISTGISIMNRYKLNDGTQMTPVKRLAVLTSIEKADTVNNILESMYGPSATLNLNIGSKVFQRSQGRTIQQVTVVDQPSGYSDYWSLSDLDRAEKMLFMAWGWKPRLSDETDKRKGLFYKEGSVLFQPMARDWRFGLFSKGDGSNV